MAEEREKKRKKSSASGAPEPAAAASLKAGDLLRQTREEKGLELEEISSAIHVRVGQLRAIEEGHVETLPGMTYALGFVKSYASYLKLDPAEVANSFKAEHGMAPAKPDLKFPEPIAETKMPDPLMIGAAVLCLVVIGIGWMIFSDSGEKNVIVSNNIPPPPPAEIASIAATAQHEEAASTAPAPLPTGAPPPATAPSAMAAAAPAAASAPAAAPAPAQNDAAVTDDTTDDATSAVLPRPKPKSDGAAETVAETAPAAATKPQADPSSGSDTINVKPGRGHVMLQATQTAWVQVTDSRGGIVLKKVLRSGERFYASDDTIMTLVTSNAGGLDVYVDGRKVQPLGGRGEIVRGVRLTPEYLSRPRYQSRAHD